IDEQRMRGAQLAHSHEHYERYVDLLMLMHQRDPEGAPLAQAFEASERARARGLFELLQQALVDVRSDLDPELLAREQTVRAKLAATANRQARMRNQSGRGESFNSLARQIDALTDEYEEVQTQIRRRSPNYSALTQAPVIELSEIQQELLDSNSLLL